MSIEGQALGAATVAGSGAAAASHLANTGDPIVIGIFTAAVLILVLGFVTRAAQRR